MRNYNRIFPFALAGVFFLGIIIFLIRSSSLDSKYPEMTNKTSVNDTIVAVIRDGRASARVAFKSNKKLTLPWGKTLIYSEELNLPRFVMEGDILIKEPLSDTIIVQRAGKKYLFVANRTIK
jgi:hypothetical protein